MAYEYSGFVYYSGQEPTVGDVVKVRPSHGLDYYSPLVFQKSSDTKYIVKSVRKSSTSALIKVTDINGKSVGGEVCAKHFNLVESANNTKPSTDTNFIVVDMVTGNVVKTGSDEVKITDFMKQKIEDNYKLRLGLYSLVGIAASEKPKVIFRRPGQKLVTPKSTPDLFINSNSPDDFFKKT